MVYSTFYLFAAVKSDKSVICWDYDCYSSSCSGITDVETVRLTYFYNS